MQRDQILVNMLWHWFGLKTIPFWHQTSVNAQRLFQWHNVVAVGTIR